MVQETAPVPRWGPAGVAGGGWLVGGAVAAAAAVGAVLGTLPEGPVATVVVGGLGLLLLVVVVLGAPQKAALATLVALPLGGLARRASGSYLAPVDPLTLVGPAVAATCLLGLWLSGRRGVRTPLSAVVAAFLALGAVHVFNPAQGGPVVGLLGAGLFVGPLLWFFVGQRIGDEAAVRALGRGLGVVALGVAAYGMKQLLVGFAGFEERWITSRLPSYAALSISGSIRPFSTFASGAEYAYFLALGAIQFAGWRRGPSRLVRGVAVVLLLVSSLYAGSRIAFVAGVLGVVAVTAARRLRRVGLALAFSLALGVLGLALLRMAPVAVDDSAAAKIQNRTLGGLARPFDSEQSTLGLRLSGFARGVALGVRNPLGHGSATVNLAGVKVGGPFLAGEHDVPDVLVAYGWAGGALLVVLCVRVYRLVAATVVRRRALLFPPAVFALVMFGSWFVGGLYAVSALVWFFLGSLDRLEREAAGDTAREAGRTPASALAGTV